MHSVPPLPAAPWAGRRTGRRFRIELVATVEEIGPLVAGGPSMAILLNRLVPGEAMVVVELASLAKLDYHPQVGDRLRFTVEAAEAGPDSTGGFWIDGIDAVAVSSELGDARRLEVTVIEEGPDG